MLKKVIREKDKEKLDMNVFKELGKDLNYKDILQVDGAFSACHINYGKSLKFNGADSKNMAQNSRKNSLTDACNIFIRTFQHCTCIIQSMFIYILLEIFMEYS